MKNAKELLVGLALCAAGVSASSAIVNTDNYITAESSAVQLSNGFWRYTYAVTTSPTSPAPIFGFSIRFFSDVDLSCPFIEPNAWSCTAFNLVGFSPTSIVWSSDAHDNIYIYPGQTLGSFNYDSSYAPIRYNDRLSIGFFRTNVVEQLDVLGPGSPQAIAAFGIPEPSTLLLAAAGMAGLALSRRR